MYLEHTYTITHKNITHAQHLYRHKRKNNAVINEKNNIVTNEKNNTVTNEKNRSNQITAREY